MAERRLSRPRRCHAGDTTHGDRMQVKIETDAPASTESISQVCLQLADALARRLFGILITLPLVFDLQTGPFIRVYRLDVGSLEIAVRSWLWCQEGRVYPTPRFGMLAFSKIDLGTSGNANGCCPDNTVRRASDLKITRIRVACAACDSNRTDNDEGGPKLSAQGRQAARTQLRLCGIAAIVCTMRRPRHRHAVRSVSKRGYCDGCSQQISRQKRGDLEWKI
jgi:hypothetical protein